MKKLLFLLLLTTSMFGQAEYEKISIVDNVLSSSTAKINTQETDGQINYIPATSLPVSTATTLQLAKKQFLSTGLVKNGLVTINADPTKYNVSAGIGVITNFDDPENPVSTIVNFGPITGHTPAY